MNFWKWLLYSSLLTCNFAQSVLFTLEIFRRVGTESCAVIMGTVDPNPSLIQEKVCTRMLLEGGALHFYQDLQVECIEPGVVDVKFYYSPCTCGDSSCQVVTRFIYGTCTKLPDQLYERFNMHLYGRALWEDGCIDSSVSTSTLPTVSPTKMPATSVPSATPSASPSISPTASPSLSPTHPTGSPSVAPTTQAEFVYAKLEMEGASCATEDKGKLAAAIVTACDPCCDLHPTQVEVPMCVQNESSSIVVHWVKIESRKGSLRTYISSEEFASSMNQILHPEPFLMTVTLEDDIPTTTQEATIISTTNESKFEIGVGVMFSVLLFLLGAWILIHCVLYWKFAFYKNASLFQWESLTWTLFLAHTFDFCSDVFVCYETSCIFGKSSWPFLVSCFSLASSICVNFYHLIKFLNFSFRNTETKHWLLKDNGLQMIVFIFLLCGGNPSFLSVLASMVIINRVPLTAIEIMHFSSHRWTVVVMENIPQLIVGIWTLQESKKSVKVFVILSIAFSFISSVSILIISWYQKHHEIVPIRMEIKIYNIPRLRRIHFIPVQKLLERVHEGISIEVYHVQQTTGGLTIRFAVYEIHADKYEKSKREAISKFTALFRDRTDWLHKKGHVEDFAKVKGTARRIKAFPEMDIEKLSSVEGEVGERERGHTEFDIRCPNSPSEEGESYALDACQMSFRTYSTCTSDSELHHWGESPQQSGACKNEGFQSTSPRACESNL